MNRAIQIPLEIVNAFTEASLFSGNPAAVCRLPAGLELSGPQMQAIAAQHNLSETAFVRPRAEGGWALRWFTPACEVDLCGHATLAAAHTLQTKDRPNERLRFETRSGALVVESEAGDPSLLWMDFPAHPITTERIGASVRNVFPDAVGCGRNALDYLLVELPTAAQVAAYVPRAAELIGLDHFGVILTGPGEGAAVDFVSRFFAPQAGILEDPVTGSAHASLFPFWAARQGREALTARQLSARGGWLCSRPAEPGRVWIGGRTRTYARGEIMLESA